MLATSASTASRQRARTRAPRLQSWVGAFALLLFTIGPSAASAHRAVGTLRIDNDRSESVRIFVAGPHGEYDYLATVPAHSDRDIRMGVGTVRLEVVGRANRVLERDTVQIRAERLAIVEVEEARGSIVVDNPLPIPVVVEASRGQRRTIAARSSVRFTELAPGRFELMVRRTSGEWIGRVDTTIREARTVHAVVPEPRTGLATIRNREEHAIRVYVDGQYRGTLSPRASERLVLRPGSHEVRAVTVHGHIIFDRWVEVDRYREQVVDIAGAWERNGYVYNEASGASWSAYYDGDDWHVEATWSAR